MNVKERAFWFVEEFTDFSLFDKKRGSLIINIKQEFFHTIYRELKKLDYTLVHKTAIKDGTSLTLVFVQL